jgi:hypothetical protein
MERRFWDECFKIGGVRERQSCVCDSAVSVCNKEFFTAVGSPWVSICVAHIARHRRCVPSYPWFEETSSLALPCRPVACVAALIRTKPHGSDGDCPSNVPWNRRVGSIRLTALVFQSNLDAVRGERCFLPRKHPAVEDLAEGRCERIVSLRKQSGHRRRFFLPLFWNRGEIPFLSETQAGQSLVPRAPSSWNLSHCLLVPCK